MLKVAEKLEAALDRGVALAGHPGRATKPDAAGVALERRVVQSFTPGDRRHEAERFRWR